MKTLQFAGTDTLNSFGWGDVLRSSAVSIVVTHSLRALYGTETYIT